MKNIPPDVFDTISNSLRESFDRIPWENKARDNVPLTRLKTAREWLKTMSTPDVVAVINKAVCPKCGESTEIATPYPGLWPVTCRGCQNTFSIEAVHTIISPPREPPPPTLEEKLDELLRPRYLEGDLRDRVVKQVIRVVRKYDADLNKTAT